MGKYEPLGQFLRRQRHERLHMTFAEIERILRHKLPASKQHRAWWSNNPDNNVMTREWLDAGYETAEVDIENERLVFVRREGPDEKPPGHEISIFGCMKGMVTFAPDYDPEAPAIDIEDWNEDLLSQEKRG